jgi:negative regulator of flagellin synthesis FlgM
MRIDLYSSAAGQLGHDANPSQVKAGNAAPVQSGAAEDRTTLTSGSASVESLVSAAMNTPEIRQDKIAALQQAISNGSYKLDPQQIAASMLDEHA